MPPLKTEPPVQCPICCLLVPAACEVHHRIWHSTLTNRPAEGHTHD